LSRTSSDGVISFLLDRLDGIRDRFFKRYRVLCHNCVALLKNDVYNGFMKLFTVLVVGVCSALAQNYGREITKGPVRITLMNKAGVETQVWVRTSYVDRTIKAFLVKVWYQVDKDQVEEHTRVVPNPKDAAGVPIHTVASFPATPYKAIKYEVEVLRSVEAVELPVDEL
jgi:hypothetical protein